MKRSLALFFLLLLCSRPVFASQHYLGQFYSGEAKPRAEVAWIWTGIHARGTTKVYFHQIDHICIREISQPPAGNNRFAQVKNLKSIRAVEVLPGKHIISLGYDDGNARSKGYLEVLIDAKAGENYVIDGVLGSKWAVQEKWNTTLSSYNPDAKEIENLTREIVERSVSVDGFVQSWEHKQLVLTLSGSVPPRKFNCNFTVLAGQKIRVLFFPSSPEDAVYVSLIE